MGSKFLLQWLNTYTTTNLTTLQAAVSHRSHAAGACSQCAIIPGEGLSRSRGNAYEHASNSHDLHMIIHTLPAAPWTIRL